MKITLLKLNYNPIDISVGSARTCYSVNLKTPEETEAWDRKFSLIKDLLSSGHHTTLQHVHFTFLMEGISRLSIWRFFHSHRFYNSDQVSQRYTEVKPGSFYDFKNEEFENLHIELINDYNKITELLIPIFEDSSNKVEAKLAKKKAMENARYILPQSILANMYHTINLSTLIRYYVSARLVKDCTAEVVDIVDSMVNEVLIQFPELKDLFESSLKNFKLNENINLYPYQNELINFYKKNKLTELKDHTSFENNTKHILSGDTLGLSALFNSQQGTENFKFNLRLSLSADAQNQRHRTAYGIRPVLLDMIKEYNYSDLNNYYIPSIFEKSPEAKKIYLNSIQKTIAFFDKNIANKNIDNLSYILPNAFLIPISEVNSALDFIHKAEKRLCLNSQEEITRMTWDMVENIIASENINLSNFGKTLAPPCYHRYLENIKPICPEGDRFCGIKEWKNNKYNHN